MAGDEEGGSDVEGNGNAAGNSDDEGNGKACSITIINNILYCMKLEWNCNSCSDPLIAIKRNKMSNKATQWILISYYPLLSN